MIIKLANSSIHAYMSSVKKPGDSLRGDDISSHKKIHTIEKMEKVTRDVIGQMIKDLIIESMLFDCLMLLNLLVFCLIMWKVIEFMQRQRLENYEMRR